MFCWPNWERCLKATNINIIDMKKKFHTLNKPYYYYYYLSNTCYICIES